MTSVSANSVMSSGPATLRHLISCPRRTTSSEFLPRGGIALRVAVMVEGRENGLRSSVVEWMYLGSSVQKLQERKIINTVNQVVE